MRRDEDMCIGHNHPHLDLRQGEKTSVKQMSDSHLTYFTSTGKCEEKQNDDLLDLDECRT